MQLITRIKYYIETRRKKKLINRLRGHLAFFGHDTSSMSDGEVERCVLQMGKSMSKVAKKTGLTVDDLSENLRRLGAS